MKKLYINSIHTLLVLFAFILLVSSCSKKNEPDPLDQYVGNWDSSTFNGQTSTSGGVSISKSADGLTLSDFTANDFTAKVSGSGFEADDNNINTGQVNQFPDNSTGLLYLQNLTGSVSGNKLTLKYTLYGQTSTMYLKLDVTHVFTKK